jgi:hypothetical protein
LIQQEQPQFKNPLEHLKYKVYNCKRFYVRYYCDGCGNTEQQPLTCGSRYCKRCYEQRYHKALKRLFNYKIYSERLFHLVIGFPRNNGFDKKEKRKQEIILSRFLKEIRKYYKFNAIRVFDLGKHYAVLPEAKQFDARLFNRIITEVSNGVVKIVKLIGWRNKKSLFKYIAQRIAGRYGHTFEGSKEFYLSDFLTIEEYYNLYFKIRSLVLLTKLVTCNNAPNYFSNVCSICGSTMRAIDIVEVLLSDDTNT